VVACGSSVAAVENCSVAVTEDGETLAETPVEETDGVGLVKEDTTLPSELYLTVNAELKHPVGGLCHIPIESLGGRLLSALFAVIAPKTLADLMELGFYIFHV
jgi:hypothetical protein